MLYERQKAHRKAFEWIVGLVREKDIPFLICGGLAAIGYGAERDLHDIVLFVPGEAFEKIVEAGKDFISKRAGHCREAGWDLDYVQFIYGGVKVEVRKMGRKMGQIYFKTLFGRPGPLFDSLVFNFFTKCSLKLLLPVS